MSETWDGHFRETILFWVRFAFVPVVVIIGVLGNILTIYILTRKKIRIHSRVYLIALTLSDLLCLLSSFTLTWKHYEYMKSAQLYWKFIPFSLWITDAASSTSVWLTVAFTVERYVAIRHPLLTKIYSRQTEKKAAVISAFVFVMGFVLTLSTPFEWQVVLFDQANKSVANFTLRKEYILENTTFGKNVWFQFVYQWFSSALFVYLPLLILIGGNVCLINAVRSSHKLRQQLVSCYVHQHRARIMRQQDLITINLIVFVIVFFICQLPTAAILIYTHTHTPMRDSVEENVLLGLGNMFNLLVAVNAECNFILYSAISEKYRKSFLRLFFLDAVFKRWYDRKRSSHVRRGIQIISSSQKQFMKTEQGGGAKEEKEDKTESKENTLKRRNTSLELMKKCTTCVAVKTRSMSELSVA